MYYDEGDIYLIAFVWFVDCLSMMQHRALIIYVRQSISLFVKDENNILLNGVFYSWT